MRSVTAGVLDNPVWHALTGPSRALGEQRDHAARFDPEVSPFSAICDEACAQGWDDLRTLIGPGRRGVLFRPTSDVPDGWNVDHRIPCVQMVAERATGAEDDRFIALGPHDVDEMLALVAATEPGPFGKRTIEFGGYIGLRENGTLVAMAGERLHVPGYSEISAVCTLPSHQRRGLGGALVLSLVHGIRSRGEEAFLHASASNETAIRLYGALGFVVRSEPDAFVVRAPE